jgi:pimeloyl-ACP methyl ester carboxylesterase
VLLLVFAAVTALIVFLPFSSFCDLSPRRSGSAGTRFAEPAFAKEAYDHGGRTDRVAWRLGPLLVLLHGAGDQAGTWHKVVPELKRHFQLVIPDLAGHGESDPVAGALSLGTLLTALEQVLDAKPWRDAPMVFAGNSLGAWMAMLYAQKYPQRVTRVILIDGGPIKNVSEIGIMPKDREEARRALDAVLDPSTPRRPNFVLDDLVRISNTVRFRGCWLPAKKLCRNTCSMTNWQISSCRSISSGVPPIASCRWIMRRSCNRSFRIARLRSLSVAAMDLSSSVPGN